MKKGYKALNGDMTCRGFKFKVGKTYETKKPIELCKSGFHYCNNIFDVYNYYEKSSKTLIAEIEDYGDTKIEGDKSVTNKIKIVKVLSDKEIIDVWINKTNSGNSNSGYGNSGNRNSGDWNSGDGNSGFFNTTTPLYFFNKPSNIEYIPNLGNKIRSINVKPILEWIGSTLMTETEKNSNPSHVTTGGFLRKTERMDWRNLTQQDKEFIKSLPNFDDKIFQVISNGVSLSDDVEVIINGKTKTISLVEAKKLGLVD